MTQPPMFRLSPARTSATRAVCWAKRLNSDACDHISLDSQIAEALAWAWRARGALRLSGAAAARIAWTIDRCARHSAWRFPHALKNQINWNAQLYANAALVTGRDDLLRRDYRRHMLRFTARRLAPRMRSANFGPGYAFRYSPHLPPWVPTNFDTPEYANIVATALRYHGRALRAGMKPLPARTHGRLRDWVSRLVTGSWTHAGYLNWDTGHGRRRWHSGQYWAFAQQGLLAIAAAPEFWPRPEYGRWAKRSSIAAWRSTRAGRPRPAACSRRSCRLACSRPTATRTCTPRGWRRTRCARSGSGSAGWAPRTRPRCTRSTATRAGSR